MQFAEAIEWGERGRKLKGRSDVDTQWSAHHALALAQRDFGQPDIALPTFLAGIAIEKVIDPDEFNENIDPLLHGNVGRCLHLMGQIDPALICYRKCALLLQRDKRPHVENQGFIRKWIGELLMAKGDFCSAKTFFQAARTKWRLVSPQRAQQVDKQLNAIENQTQNCSALNIQIQRGTFSPG